MCGVPWKILGLLLCGALGFSTYFIATVFDGSIAEPQIFKKAQIGRINLQDGEGCELPFLDPWDPSVTQFLDPQENPFKNCNKTLFKHTELADGVLRIANDSSKFCKYRCLLPVGADDYKTTDWTTMEADYFYNVTCDFVETECRSSNGSIVFHYIHEQVRRLEAKTFQKEDTMHPSVMIIVLDSVSSSTVRRSLMETNEIMRLYFQTTTFLYLNKVGINSSPNGHAIFCGNRVENIDQSFLSNETDNAEVKNSCEEYLRRNETIIYDFVDAKYVTMIAEDWMPLFSYPDCKGFNGTPTDHYAWPLIQRSDYEDDWEEFAHYFYHEDCEHEYQKLMKYVSSFLQAYEGTSKFSYIWISSISHESPSGLYHTDKFFADFFRKNARYLQGSFIFVMSDHGFRRGDIRSTIIGRHEDNNPFLSISVPKFLRQNEQLMRNLRRNARNHISHYDIYATLYDIAHVAGRSGFTKWDHHDFRRELGGVRGGVRALSLLRPITYNRTCEEMSISQHYCLCLQNWVSVDVNSTTAVAAANLLFESINSFLAQKGLGEDCATLSLKQVKVAKKRDKKPVYLISAIAEPSDGEYEAILSLQNGKFVVTSQVTRNDRYGDQGHCAPGAATKHICYCIKQLSTAPESSTFAFTSSISDNEITEISSESSYVTIEDSGDDEITEISAESSYMSMEDSETELTDHED